MFDFETKVESLDDVPEKFRSLYEPKDGAFALVPELAKKVEAGAGLASAIEKERKRAADARRELQAWTALGATPEEAQAAFEAKHGETATKLAELQKIIDSKGDASAQFEKWKHETEGKYRKEVETRDAAITERDREIERLLIEGEATTALADLKGNLKVLLPHVKSQVKIFVEGKRRVARPVDEDGDPRSDGKGGFMTIKQLVEEMRNSDDFAANFSGDQTSGSGSTPGAAPKPKAANTYSKADWLAKTSSAKPEERAQLLRDLQAGKIRVA